MRFIWLVTVSFVTNFINKLLTTIASKKDEHIPYSDELKND